MWSKPIYFGGSNEFKCYFLAFSILSNHFLYKKDFWTMPPWWVNHFLCTLPHWQSQLGRHIFFSLFCLTISFTKRISEQCRLDEWTIFYVLYLIDNPNSEGTFFSIPCTISCTSYCPAHICAHTCLIFSCY
jgi:hypothetical protein